MAKKEKTLRKYNNIWKATVRQVVKLRQALILGFQ